ncbi:hypothetical protein M231_06540 [Tremella mesenterica]|uniref:Uncharacterized protein n=1 Tax=Tremella mesenterica TaxID=5217 RepID=A0A4Q1BDR4_TREME|nr:uncharacterized protein TREMEDRAFT_25545 [Tremella mesenterica DSM 1558]EIW72640.1 hypothetical protein TREMEDRAFT_25545 [Tremella mesenterica DSM 1558]RXK36196.1 hypothetical protein M231_06540 [Tremella mesenterica]
MSRLASLSTPSRTSSTPLVPSPETKETTHHRMFRDLIQSIISLIDQWDDLVSHDGPKYGKICVDARTSIENILQLEENPDRPSILPFLIQLRNSRSSLNDVLIKLDKSLGKLQSLVEVGEGLFIDAYSREGVEFVLKTPMWMTWTMDRFVNSLPSIFTLHSIHLSKLRHLSQLISSSETTFDQSKLALEQWQDLSRCGERHDEVEEWRELVEWEMTWGQPPSKTEEKEKLVTPKSGKKKGK